MSKQAMKEVLERAMSDEAFARGLVEAVGTKEGTAAIEAVAAYGAGNSYDVTTEDALAMQWALLGSELEDSDLDDTDLENVAGGVGGLGQLAGLMGGGGALGGLLGGGLGGGLATGVVSATANTAINAGAGVAKHAVDQGAAAVNAFVKQW